jgi:hypothetical protein
MVDAQEIDGSLMTLCEEPTPSPMDELKREHGGGVDVVVAVARLVRRGPALRLEGDYVIASAAGRHAVAMSEETP